MKKQAVFILSLVAMLFAACQNEPAPTAKATTPEPAQITNEAVSGLYAINTENSVIEWVGTKPTGSQHNGTIKLQSGELNLFQGNINGGKMVLDMGSIAVTDLAGDKKADLESHLKDGDFFDVGKFSTGSFEFGSTQPLANDPSGAKHVATGSLTLKGIAKPIRIPFNFSFEGGKITVETPEFSINRLEWDIKYKSGFIGTVKEKMIDDFVKLKIKLVAEAPVQ
ncbi:MAG: YceI family protein [Saprospiraceae bacterium]|nr:YceI family protein [Saprospiraceae bacterium]MCF8248931.1 YceI family protein [Saprospiraceae bacterium]MCF8279142.1 YceI family protein [Bacteroidales bacterium]MCF8310825.1 YceI family protein [Saprospiraceae bacterium]MCF8439587.1 YceI family protein [Saprospiraceae bacterium]